MYDIVFEKRALKFFEKLDSFTQNKIGKKIEKLKQNPKIGVPLIGEFKGLWKLRVGKYRAIYQIVENKLVIFVLNIGHRKNVYSQSLIFPYSFMQQLFS